MELVIAITVMTIAGAGLMQIALTSSHGQVRSADEATASALAVEKLEELKNRGYNALVGGTESGLTESGTSGGTVYSRAWAVSGEHLVAGSPAKTITATVRWQPGGSVTLSTRMVNPQGATQSRPRVVMQAWDQSQ